MFLIRLKAETRPWHAAIERQIDLNCLCGSRAAYARHLTRLYGFYQPLEEVLWQTETGDEEARDPERRKTPLLLRDLRALGINPQEQPLCCALPTVVAEGQMRGSLEQPRDFLKQRANFDAMGCHYVLEGASLGGQVITRLVRERLGISPEDGGAFFHGYGKDTAAMWETFRVSLEQYAQDREYAQNQERQESIIRSACATFEALGRWLHPDVILEPSKKRMAEIEKTNG